MKQVNTVWYTAGSSGLTDFSNGTALTGYRNIASGGLTNGAVYSYRAEHPTDKTIWENGRGTVDTGTGVLARTTIVESSTGAKINFATAPVISLSPMKADWDGIVSYDEAQSAGATQQTQARSNIAAAPYNALAFQNLIKNAGMEVSQEYSTNAIAIAPPGSRTYKYVADGVYLNYQGTWGGSVQQVPDGPPGYRYSLKLSVSTADSSPSTVLAALVMPIEGIDFAKAAFGTASAQSLALGFMVKAHRPGQYSYAFRPPNQAHNYIGSFTINAADTWEYKTAVIPGDTGGTWPTGAALGAELIITVAAASGNNTAAGGYYGGNFMGVTGQTNGVAATTDTFQITGVTLYLAGQVPPSVSPQNLMLPFDAELLRCQRYYQKSYDYGTVPGSNSINGVVSSVTVATASYPTVGNPRFTPRMRGLPVITLYNQASGSTSNPIRITSTGTDIPGLALYGGDSGFLVHVNGYSVAANEYITTHYVADARM